MSYMSWPFHCDAPSLRVLSDGTNGSQSVEVSWWRERDADRLLLAPLHRAAYTYVTWADPRLAGWGREAPDASLHISSEFDALQDAFRCDGTCTALQDATLSATTTAYNPAGQEVSVALDFQPCVASPASRDALWYMPPTQEYDTHGWAHRLLFSKRGCSMEYGARRAVPDGATRVTVVELGSTAGCARALCTGPAGGPLVNYGGDAIVRRASVWNIANGLPEEDTSVAVTSAHLRTVGAARRMAVAGTLSVADPLFWPGISGLSAHSEGPCAMGVGEFSLSAGRWVANFSASCAPAQTFDQAVTLNTSAWGALVWARGGARRLVAALAPTPTTAPPQVVAVPSADVVPLGGSASIRFGLALPEDEAFWEVVASGPVTYATQSRAALMDPPPRTCRAAMAHVSVDSTGPSVTVQFTNGGSSSPRRAAVCLNITLAPVRPYEGTLVWRSAAAASRFSSGGVRDAVAPDGSPAFVAAQPVWDDGSIVEDPRDPGLGYPYRNNKGLSTIHALVVSPWVGLMSAAASAPMPFVNVSSSGRLFASLAPPPSVTPAPPAADTTATLLVALGSLLLAASIVVLAVAVARSLKLSRPQPPDTPSEQSEAAHKIVQRGRPKPLGATRLMVMLVLPLCVSATGCSAARKAACTSCNGVLAVSTCACTCGWSQLEVVWCAMLFLPGVTMLMLYL